MRRGAILAAVVAVAGLAACGKGDSSAPAGSGSAPPLRPDPPRPPPAVLAVAVAGQYQLAAVASPRQLPAGPRAYVFLGADDAIHLGRTADLAVAGTATLTQLPQLLPQLLPPAPGQRAATGKPGGFGTIGTDPYATLVIEAGRGDPGAARVVLVVDRIVSALSVGQLVQVIGEPVAVAVDGGASGAGALAVTLGPDTRGGVDPIAPLIVGGGDPFADAVAALAALPDGSAAVTVLIRTPIVDPLIGE